MKTIRFFAAAALVSVLALSCNSQPELKIDAELPTSAEVDSASYLVGVYIGPYLKNNIQIDDLSELNMAELKKGIVDFLNAKGSMYDPEFGKQFKLDPNEDAERVLGGFISKRQTYKAALNHAKEEAFLSKNALKENVDTTASGLQYTIIASGDDYKVQPQDTVWVNYKGTLLDGTVFDQNDSTQFVANRVIRGWTEGLGLLGEGGKAVLYIPSELAYGSRGNHSIAPNSTLIFDVEILKVGKFIPKEDNK